MRLRLVSVLAAMATSAFAPAASAAPLGYLQVKVEKGAIVTVDEVGTRRAVDAEGVTFRDLPEGTHWVTIERGGFERQRTSTEVVAGSITVLRPKPWQPIPAGALEKKGAKGVGALIVQTFPVDATIDAKRLGWNKIEKGDLPFIAANVPVGQHKITFCNAYKCLDYRAEIRPGRLLSIIVDFDPGEIEDVSGLHRQQLASWRSHCAGGDADSCRRACDLDVALAPAAPSPAACRALEKKDDGIVRVGRSITPP